MGFWTSGSMSVATIRKQHGSGSAISAWIQTLNTWLNNRQLILLGVVVVVLFLNLWDTAVQHPPACIPRCMPAEKWRSIYFFHNVWTNFDFKKKKGRKKEIAHREKTRRTDSLILLWINKRWDGSTSQEYKYLLTSAEGKARYINQRSTVTHKLDGKDRKKISTGDNQYVHIHWLRIRIQVFDD